MSGLDILMILVFLIMCGVSVVRKLVRQTISVGVVYLATIAAGSLYRAFATFVQAIGGATPSLTQFIMFWLIFIVFSIIMEALLGQGFDDMSLPKIGVLDKILAVIPGAICALVVVCLMLTSFGYSTVASWSFLEPLRIMIARGYQGSALAPILGPALKFYLALHGLWFVRLPPLLAYALPE
ncbi:MAG: CvpA family protein [Anaerolineae bacterium]|nr:CvpA family protein [Anaerolineae bacterium]